MSNNFTVTTLHINNKKNILSYIYNHKCATPLMLHKATSLSRPTIAQILKELVLENLIYSNGLADSTGGRKANLYKFNSSIKIAVGVELLIDHFELTAIDLYGDTLKFEKKNLPFANHAAYFDGICASINQFIDSLQIEKGQLLGVGIALQALISSDGRRIIYGKILGCDGLSIDEFSQRIPHPCSFNHDAESIANVELWTNPLLQNAIYFNIRSDVSGAIIIGRKFFQDGEYKSGVFEHMTIVPNGHPCYCGKKGCVNAYCSTSALLKPEEDIQNFFLKLRQGSSSHIKRWHNYLEFLAIAIDNLHMTINSNVILGGTLSRYLTAEDISRLHQLVHKRSAFPTNKKYISISGCANLPTCIGAALPYVQNYLNSLMLERTI